MNTAIIHRSIGFSSDVGTFFICQRFKINLKLKKGPIHKQSLSLKQTYHLWNILWNKKNWVVTDTYLRDKDKSKLANLIL